MTNLWKAIFLECIFQDQCKREGMLPCNPVRVQWARAFIANRFTFTVLS